LYVEAFPKDKNRETVSLFFKIINTYIKENSSNELNLLNALKQKFYKSIQKQKENEEWVLEKLPVDYLNIISKAIFDDLYFDSFTRFRKSNLCYLGVLNYLNDENVITKTVLFSYFSQTFSHITL
jgi:hypothetical protein